MCGGYGVKSTPADFLENFIEMMVGIDGDDGRKLMQFDWHTELVRTEARFQTLQKHLIWPQRLYRLWNTLPQ
jgi:hypothetical protein